MAQKIVFLCGFFKLYPSIFIVPTEFVVLSEFCFLVSLRIFSLLWTVFVCF